MKYRYVLKNKHTNQIHFKWYTLQQIEESGLKGLFDLENYEVISRDRFTGKTTHDNIDIYENDKISMHQFLFEGEEVEKEHTGIVRYKDDTMSFNYTNIKGQWYNDYTGFSQDEDVEGVPMCDIYGLHEESFKVTGSIHIKEQ